VPSHFERSLLPVLRNVEVWLNIKLTARRPQEISNVLKRIKLSIVSHFYEAFCSNRLNNNSPKLAQQLQMAASVPTSGILPDNVYLFPHTQTKLNEIL
jgi:hypothetical protein